VLKSIVGNMLDITKQEQNIIDIIGDHTKVIFVLSRSGRATQLVAKFKPNKIILGVR
jgi:pyruvate kinase